MTKKQSKLTILPLFLTCLIACGCSKHLAPAAQIRNVLFISADDHAAYAVGVYGNRIVRTPNLDRLASQGTLFERAFTNSPLSPVRAFPSVDDYRPLSIRHRGGYLA